jgi:predicted nucleic acid-binding protein
MRAGSTAARKLLDLLDGTSALDLEWIDPDRFATAKALFRKQLDQGFSFTDCTSFLVMEERRIIDAVTTSAHFVVRGYRRLLEGPD